VFGPIPTQRFQPKETPEEMTDKEKRAERRAVYNRRYYEANKDKLTANTRAKYAANTEPMLEYQREYYAANKNAVLPQQRAYRLQRDYGLSQDQFDGMLAAQNSACAICHTTEPKGQGAFHVDHCHSSGVVRGLLCHSCNVGLGHFRDDTALLMRATEYLAASRTIH
jgi:cytochrome c peroxidase